MSSSGKIVNLVNPTNNQDAATKSYVDTKFITVPTPTNTQDAANKGYVDTKFTTVPTPTNTQDAANKGYVDSIVSYNGSGSLFPTVERNDTAQTTHYLTFISSNDLPSNGNNKRVLLRSDANLYYNPNADTLYAGTFSGTSTYALTAANIDNPGNSTFTVNGSERMRISSGGYVGIGTNSPTAPLHVSGSVNQNSNMSGTRRYLKSDGTAGTWNPDGQALNVSIISENEIWCKGTYIWITSDQRIKTNIVNLNADKMINVFRNLRPISFDFIDPMKTNNKKHFGFIAQEVNEVLPEGISLNTDVIPNNMMKADIAKPSERYEIPCFTLKPTDIDITLQYLLLTTDTPLIFDISNSYSSTNTYKFKIYCGKEWVKEHDIYIRSEYNVTDDKYTYVIGMKKEAYDIVITEPTLFVYGQYVYDLHILDTDTIYTVATAALQEVDRQQQADKARIAELEATVSTHQSLINDILERLKALEKA